MATYEDKRGSEATFRYTVENFFMMKDSQVSPPYYVYDLPWKIMVTPYFSQTRKQKYLSFYLQCNRESKSDSWNCYAVAQLRLLSNKEGQEPFSRNFQRLFCTKHNSWGFSEFMAWQDVLDIERGYIKYNSITLEVHIVADNYEEKISRILEETKQDIRGVEQSIQQLKQEVVNEIETLTGDAEDREERRKAASEEMANRILEETKQEMSKVELSMRQWLQEIADKIEMFKGNTDKSEEKREAAYSFLSEKLQQETIRVESITRQWKQEIVETIEMLGAEISKEMEKQKFQEPMMQRDEKREEKIRENQLEANKWEEMPEGIESVQKAFQKKNMLITGLGILFFIILNIYILPGCLYMYPRIA